MAPVLRSSSSSSSSSKAERFFHHPSYLQMVAEAIVSLRQRWGSSLREVNEYVCIKYGTCLPFNFQPKVMRTLQQLTRQGILQTTRSRPMKYRFGKMIRAAVKQMITKSSSVNRRLLTRKYISSLCNMKKSCNGDATACSPQALGAVFLISENMAASFSLPPTKDVGLELVIDIIVDAKDQLRYGKVFQHVVSDHNKRFFLNNVDHSQSKDCQELCLDANSIEPEVSQSVHDIVPKFADVQLLAHVSIDDESGHVSAYVSDDNNSDECNLNEEVIPYLSEETADCSGDGNSSKGAEDLSCGHSDKLNLNEEEVTAHLNEEKNVIVKNSGCHNSSEGVIDHLDGRLIRSRANILPSLERPVYYGRVGLCSSQARLPQTKRIRVMPFHSSKLKVQTKSSRIYPKAVRWMSDRLEDPCSDASDISGRNRTSRHYTNSVHNCPKSLSQGQFHRRWIWQPTVRNPLLLLPSPSPSRVRVCVGSLCHYGTVLPRPTWSPYGACSSPIIRHRSRIQLFAGIPACRWPPVGRLVSYPFLGRRLQL